MSLDSEASPRRVLVTGAAGFIGYHVCKQLLEAGHRVVGLDNLNDYYSVQLKRDRLAALGSHRSLEFIEGGLEDRGLIEGLFAAHGFDRVIHLAAQAGVRYSLENPHVYLQSNIVGQLQVLEACRHHRVGHFVYASSSSVYGANTRMPFRVADNVDHPVSLYAATKKAGELMAHTYSHLFQVPTTGLRFFTVYGPWGRPDMALFKFTEAILAGKPIDVYGEGKMQRDFTYIDDVVEGVIRVMDHVPTGDADWTGDHPNPATSRAPYRIFNIGNHQPVALERFIEVIEQACGKAAIRRHLPMQPGDVPATYADVADLQAAVGFSPKTPIELGVQRFVDWYRQYVG
jgi:UDP-glucuronate 4-epimerase